MPLIIIPTYNEAENIGELLSILRRSYPEANILVVDDNSPDKTSERVQNTGMKHIHLLTRPQKRGLSGAYLAGFQWALERNYDPILQMDADFSHNPKDVCRLLETLKSTDVAVGCRYIEGGSTVGWSTLRRSISRGGNFYARWILGLPYFDLTSGFNAWRRCVLEKIDLSSIRSRGYAFQVELKYRAAQNGFRIHEIPIQFEDRRRGKSKMHGRIVWEAAFRVFQMRFVNP